MDKSISFGYIIWFSFIVMSHASDGHTVDHLREHQISEEWKTILIARI